MNFLAAFKTKTPFDFKLSTLYILNVSDYIFTLILLSTGFFVEGNPILGGCIDSVGGFVLKCLLPLALLLYIRLRLAELPKSRYKSAKFLLNIGLTLYSVINIFHMFCFVLLAVYF